MPGCNQFFRHACPPVIRGGDGEHREDLGNAIALNSSMVNAARLLGPAVGGVVIAGLAKDTAS